jgi:hypothetical protein
MIRPYEILDCLTARPFQPFRIHMVSGKTYDIRHPEMVKVGATTLAVFTYLSQDEAERDRWETVSLSLIERIYDLDLASDRSVRG